MAPALLLMCPMKKSRPSVWTIPSILASLLVAVGCGSSSTGSGDTESGTETSGTGGTTSDAGTDADEGSSTTFDEAESSSTTTEDEDSSSTGDEEPSPIDEVPCRFAVADDLVEGADYSCGDLFVPEVRDGRTVRPIAVHFVRFFGPANSSQATIYLDGGPGGSGQSFAALPSPAIQEFTANGDFVVVAQRGTVNADPPLMCPAPIDMSAAAEAASACRDELEAEGIVLEGYTTPSNADDIEDLRRALGYEQWNLFGISYGTRLAQEIIRRHPDTVRSAVLDGVVSPTLNWDARSFASFWGAMQGMSAACDGDATCSSAFAPLDQALVDMVVALDADPIVVTEPVMLTVDGAFASSMVFRMMYSTSLYPLVPLVVTSLRDRNPAAVATFLMLFFEAQTAEGSALALGMHNSIKCSDLFNPELGPGIDAVLDEADVPAPLATVGIARYQSSVETCGVWPTPESMPELSAPVASDIPTLVTSGAFDPITPPSYGSTVAEDLTQTIEVVFANSGHGAIAESDCSRELLFGFLADPEASVAELDTSCATELGVAFVETEEEFFGGLTPAERRNVSENLRQPPI